MDIRKSAKSLLDWLIFLWPITTILIGVLLLLTFLLLYEYLPSSPLPDYKIEGVGHIYMHEQGRYTIEVNKPGTKEFTLGSLTQDRHDLGANVVVKDVPEDDFNYIVIKQVKNGLTGGIQNARLEFHIKPSSKIQGGSWNHGKSGKGTTQTID